MIRRGYGIATVLLVLIIILGVGGTVMSKENSERARQNRYYGALEEEYRERTRVLLEEEGYHNCGINLTWVAYENGSREYTLLLHHRKLNRLNDEEKTALRNILSETEFQEEACSFRYDL